MSALPNIALLLALAAAQAQTTQPAGQTRRAVLEQSLSKFDAATATKAKDAAAAQRLYREALEGFESLVNSGVDNGKLHFNIANTCMALNQLGPAIAHYRIAQRLLPADPAIEHNLQTARRLVQVSFKRPAASTIVETLFFWHFSTSQSARLRIAMAGYAIFWLLMRAMINRSRRTPLSIWTAAIIAIVATAAGASVAYQQLSQRNSPEAVLIASEATLRKGTGDYYDPQLVQPLPEGVEFHVRSERNDVQNTRWYQIELPDGREGWLHADQVMLLDGTRG
jgi:tetratricopeptide (TPR) repeat protein